MRGNMILSGVAGACTVAQIVLTFVLPGRGLEAVRIVGYCLWVLAALLGIGPVLAFRRRGGVAKGKGYIHTTRLVTTGLYAVVRHPQYLSFHLVNASLACMSQHWLVVCLGAVSIALNAFTLSDADESCVRKFGEEYRRYMSRVPGLNLPLGVYGLLRRRLQRREQRG